MGAEQVCAAIPARPAEAFIGIAGCRKAYQVGSTGIGVIPGACRPIRDKTAAVPCGIDRIGLVAILLVVLISLLILVGHLLGGPGAIAFEEHGFFEGLTWPIDLQVTACRISGLRLRGGGITTFCQ